MKDADQPRADILLAAEKVDQPAETPLAKPDRQGVSREIPAEKVVLDGPGADLGQSAGMRIALFPGSREIDLMAMRRSMRRRQGNRGGPETAVAYQLTARPPAEGVRELDSRPHDGDVQVIVLPCQDEVTHESPDQVRVHAQFIGYPPGAVDQGEDIFRQLFKVFFHLRPRMKLLVH